MVDKDLRELLANLKVFEKMYDIARLIDPVSKKVVKYENNTITNEALNCFNFWGKNKICKNCASMRAYNDDKSIVKIEYTLDKTYMLTAIPVEYNNRRIIVELLKDLTDSVVFETGMNSVGNGTDIITMVDNINDLAVKDDLTGIYNRRYINEKLPVDILNAVITKKDLAFVMADIDFFKDVNDTYGHLTGDCAIKEFVNILTKNVQRDGDWVARFGGEEFIICLPGASLEKAVSISENIRKILQDTIMECNGNKINIKASFGVCSIKSSKITKAMELINCADAKLYQAKHNGRNRVES